MFSNGSFTTVQHFDVATQWNGCQRILGTMAVFHRKERLAKAHREPEYLNPSSACNPEVTIFMNNNQNTDRYNEI